MRKAESALVHYLHGEGRKVGINHREKNKCSKILGILQDACSILLFSHKSPDFSYIFSGPIEQQTKHKYRIVITEEDNKM